MPKRLLAMALLSETERREFDETCENRYQRWATILITTAGCRWALNRSATDNC